MRKLLFLGVLAASTVFFNSCQKEDLLGSDFSSSKTTTSSTSSSDGIDRHGPRPTPIDISQLPSSITDYVTANYAGGTIAHAGTLPNGNYAIVVENTDGTKVALLFDASGNFVQVLPPPPNGGPGGGGNHPHPTPIDVSQLPSSITDYVTANYAGGTIAHAGTLPNGNYAIVVENTDGTKVALLFDASGNFVQVLPPPPIGG